MFERRLKIFLVVLLVMTLALVLRAAQKQVLEHAHWEGEAARTRTRWEEVPTRRGTIRDVNGATIAADVPCVDAAVDYRSLAPAPDKKWVAALARARLTDRLGAQYTEAPREKRQALLDSEVVKVRDDIRQLIPRLARVSGHSEAELEDARMAIVEKVKMRRRFVWYYSYAQAMKTHREAAEVAQTRPSSVWEKWLLDDTQDAPELDNFELRVEEETAKHVILRDVDPDVQTELSRHSDRYPGLVLREGTRRVYPLGRAAAHVLGRLSKVMKEDIGKNDPYFNDELRQYQQTDLKGRGGLEGLWEPVLRGTRGRIEHVDGREVAMRKPEPGKDVKASIDIELQHEVELLFEKVVIETRVPGQAEPIREEVAMHGAAVVIDVASGEVRALASAPGFDPNHYEEEHARANDPENLHNALLTRATQAQREPGSTVKPIVGMAGVAENVRGADEAYECTGYMHLNGRPYRFGGRCWVNSMFHKDLCGPNCPNFPCPRVAHHQVPSRAPHPTGRLNLSDALERSCNPYFESIAHALGPAGLSNWYRKFGLGRTTGIGIAESAGRVPVMNPNKPPPRGPSTVFSTWSAGIGQGPVHATPLQMANVAATIARGGVWVRPSLLHAKQAEGVEVPPPADGPNRVDLGIPPEALRAVREGMFKVVHTAAGSGGNARRPELAVAGKTGTAEAALARVPVRDPATGAFVRNEKGRIVTEPLALSTHDAPNDLAPWHRGTGREGGKPHHSWFIGFAPADKPQVAFAVLVEYGGSGGGAAGPLANRIVELCIAHGHLKLPVAEKAPGNGTTVAGVEGGSPTEAGANVPMAVPAAAPTSAPAVAAPLVPAGVELLRDVPVTTRAAN